MKEMIYNMQKEYYPRDELVFVMPPAVFQDLLPNQEFIVGFESNYEIFGIKMVIDDMAETLYLMPKRCFGL